MLKINNYWKVYTIAEIIHYNCVFIFDRDHPIDLAILKTKFLKDLYKLTTTDTFLVNDILTATAFYEFGITDLTISLCLGKSTNKNGNVNNSGWIPYSFRIGYIENRNFNDLYEVKFVFSQNTNSPSNVKYNEMTYGKKEDLDNLPDNIKCMIDI